jgi:hypothetical protein
LRINIKVNIPVVNKDNVNEIIKRLKDDWYRKNCYNRY